MIKVFKPYFWLRYVYMNYSMVSTGSWLSLHFRSNFIFYEYISLMTSFNCLRGRTLLWWLLLIPAFWFWFLLTSSLSLPVGLVASLEFGGWLLWTYCLDVLSWAPLKYCLLAVEARLLLFASCLADLFLLELTELRCVLWFAAPWFYRLIFSISLIADLLFNRTFKLSISVVSLWFWDSEV